MSTSDAYRSISPKVISSLSSHSKCCFVSKVSIFLNGFFVFHAFLFCGIVDMVKLLMSILFETRELGSLKVLHFLLMKIREVPFLLLVSETLVHCFHVDFTSLGVGICNCVIFFGDCR